ncbi:hypothetical protein RU97_GL002053 [Enterococcus canis]|uniref:WxL domain-containing protein n=1 Tax=Enterococcus canis TaxID=214095 RepID=A0A1L8RDW3_9ENTE|nr:WxL domain-containing protein [Enterococcus canis]OJG17980.1 hypothetical protein RU97_GL002053 [Enterococcus canis]
MKNTHKIAGALLLSTLVLGVAMNSETKAAPEQTGEGKVEFTQNTDSLTPPITPPGTNEPEIIEPEPNTDPIPLKIVSVTDMDFGMKDILADGQDQTYPVLPFEAATKENPDETVTMAHFVRYQDVRVDGEANRHSITAALTDQFDNGGTKLTGADLVYKNAHLMTANNTATMPSAAALQTTFQLKEDGEAVPVLSNTEEGKGFGVFDIAFGEYVEGTDYDGVDLNVPGATVKKAGIYTATVTWTIEDARTPAP